MTTRLKALTPAPANAAADIGLINRYSMRTLTPKEIYCFSAVLCDNEVDRDLERFTAASLEKLAPLFLGKPVLMDHRWSAEKQTARLYRTSLVDLEGRTSLGEQKKGIRGSAYMLKNETTEPIIEAIEAGILKEMSVGVAMGGCKCSICGESFRYNYKTGKYPCRNDHLKGEYYDGKRCVGDLVDPKDAYELSFVAIPAQRGAGVTKGVEDLSAAVELFKGSDLYTVPAEDLRDIQQKIQAALVGDAERAERMKMKSI